MKDLEDFFDNNGLSHIGKQIVSYFGVDDLWNLRQVNKYWKNVADIELKKLKAYYDSLLFVQVFGPFNSKNFFWKKRGAVNFIRFHDFFNKYYKEHEEEFNQRTRNILDLVDRDPKIKGYVFPSPFPIFTLPNCNLTPPFSEYLWNGLSGKETWNYLRYFCRVVLMLLEHRKIMNLT